MNCRIKRGHTIRIRRMCDDVEGCVPMCNDARRDEKSCKDEKRRMVLKSTYKLRDGYE